MDLKQETIQVEKARIRITPETERDLKSSGNEIEGERGKIPALFLFGGIGYNKAVQQ